ncbi:hypothetical protein [Clostridium sp.]|uniref:hypothetical protein n=1 Tax=Clostridium sp. TaxID=1506 RepID=UPI0034642902
MYKVEVNNAKKILFIAVGGFFQEEDGKNFLNDYNNAVKSINPSNFTLALESSDLSTSKAEMIPILENCIKMYKATGFKNIVSTPPKSAIAAMQLKRLLSSLNVDIQFISDLSQL